MGFYEAHLEGKTLAPLLAMRRLKSFKPGPLSDSKRQSLLIPSAASPLLQVRALFCVSEGFSCTPSSVLISRWSSQPALVTISLLPPLSLYSPSLGLSRSFSTPPGRVVAGARAQQALLPAAGSTHRNHLWEAHLLDGFEGFSQAGMSRTGDHQHPELKGFVTRKAESLPILPSVSLSYQVHQTHGPKPTHWHWGCSTAAWRKGRVRKGCRAHKTTEKNKKLVPEQTLVTSLRDLHTTLSQLFTIQKCGPFQSTVNRPGKGKQSETACLVAQDQA